MIYRKITEITNVIHKFKDMNEVELSFRVYPFESSLQRSWSDINIYEEFESLSGEKVLSFMWGGDMEREDARTTLNNLLKNCLFQTGPDSHIVVVRGQSTRLWSESVREHLFYFQSPEGTVRAIGMYHRHGRDAIEGERARPMATIRTTDDYMYFVTTPSASMYPSSR